VTITFRCPSACLQYAPNGAGLVLRVHLLRAPIFERLRKFAATGLNYDIAKDDDLKSLLAEDAGQKLAAQMKDYWGEMLGLGATSFWEKYDPSEKGAEHYAMYGRPFGKSLCHAWGASPIYLLGKYYLGVRPLSPGYATYSVEPVLGGLQWMEGEVPTPHGNIKVYCSGTSIRVKAVEGAGVLRFRSRSRPVCDAGVVRPVQAEKDAYEIRLEGGKEYTVGYKEVR